MFSQSSALARFERTGVLTEQQADDLGLVGPAARACGCRRDVRCDFPQGIFQFSHIPMAVETTGDVYARAVVRCGWKCSVRWSSCLSYSAKSPAGATFEPPGPLRRNAMALGVTETWRGEAVHVAFTDDAGRLAFIKVKDPSIHNWFGLALALRWRCHLGLSGVQQELQFELRGPRPVNCVTSRARRVGACSEDD